MYVYRVTGVQSAFPDKSSDITRPMDLSTVLRNVKAHKYKNKTDFGNDLDQIWKNCLTYNTTAVSGLPENPANSILTALEPSSPSCGQVLAAEDQPSPRFHCGPR